jgi:hypothetical protein
LIPLLLILAAAVALMNVGDRHPVPPPAEGAIKADKADRATDSAASHPTPPRRLRMLAASLTTGMPRVAGQGQVSQQG